MSGAPKSRKGGFHDVRRTFRTTPISCPFRSRSQIKQNDLDEMIFDVSETERDLLRCLLRMQNVHVVHSSNSRGGGVCLLIGTQNKSGISDFFAPLLTHLENCEISTANICLGVNKMVDRSATPPARP